ncbi:hypothetical protein B0H34DRAFT_388715 [Crassisporium funariophilum]|nr:hypothetical protein B0H34DRAFT_388715 [Crassisporium funariophilum]
MINSPPSLNDSSEARWKDSLGDIQKQMVIYRQAAASGDKHAIDDAVESVASAMEEVADAHYDPKVKAKWEKKAREFRASPGKRDSALREMGRGALILLATPFALAGAFIYGIGMMCSGVGSVLKGVGSLGKYAFISSRRRGL